VVENKLTRFEKKKTPKHEKISHCNLATATAVNYNSKLFITVAYDSTILDDNFFPKPFFKSPLDFRIISTWGDIYKHFYEKFTTALNSVE